MKRLRCPLMCLLIGLLISTSSVLAQGTWTQDLALGGGRVTAVRNLTPDRFDLTVNDGWRWTDLKAATGNNSTVRANLPGSLIFGSASGRATSALLPLGQILRLDADSKRGDLQGFRRSRTIGRTNVFWKYTAPAGSPQGFTEDFDFTIELRGELRNLNAALDTLRGGERALATASITVGRWNAALRRETRIDAISCTEANNAGLCGRKAVKVTVSDGDAIVVRMTAFTDLQLREKIGRGFLDTDIDATLDITKSD